LVNEYGTRQYIKQLGRLGVTLHQNVLTALEHRALRYKNSKSYEELEDERLLDEAIDETGIVPFMLARGFCREHFVSRRRAGVAVIGNFHFRQNHTPDPHLCQPLGRKCQSISPSTADVPCCDREGPATPRRRGRQRNRHRHDN
jgi:hypothetical protein